MTTTLQTGATDLPATKACLIARAAAQVAIYPQYTNHFVAYKLARVTRDIRTKMGLAFVRGEYVIAKRHDAVCHAGMVMLSAGVTAWSLRNQCDTSIKTSDVEWL